MGIDTKTREEILIDEKIQLSFEYPLAPIRPQDTLLLAGAKTCHQFSRPIKGRPHHNVSGV